MVFKKSSIRLVSDFFESSLDLKKHVFINVRKQIRQEMEGISACQL